MWHLNFIIPFVMAFVGLIALTVLLVNLLCDAILDGTAKKGGNQLVAEVVREEDVVGTRMAGQASPKSLLELPGVGQKALQCAGELAE